MIVICKIVFGIQITFRIMFPAGPTPPKLKLEEEKNTTKTGNNKRSGY